MPWKGSIKDWHWIYILLSIKTRIETIQPIPDYCSCLLIYILLSIKTRIETLHRSHYKRWFKQFISYYPLKQGLKPQIDAETEKLREIYILLSIKTRIETMSAPVRYKIQIRFISYYPLKQGLKPRSTISSYASAFDLYPTIH